MSIIMVWLLILIVMVVFEIISLGLTSIWFAGGALVALILAALEIPLWIQIVAFVVASIILLIVTRPVAKKYLNKHVVKTNAEGLIGTTAIVTKDIDNIKGIGEVVVNGMPWSARAAEDQMKISKDSIVKIQEIQGVKLIVTVSDEYKKDEEVSL